MLVYAMIAEGFEEIEAIAFIDILRRADIDIKTVSIGDSTLVRGAHGIEINTDSKLNEIDSKLETFRDYYNSNIVKYNKMVKTFPTNIVALLCKYEDKLFFDMKNMTDDDVEDFKL